MRCKRCGELLEPTDARCPVCGKTVTPPRKKAPAQKSGETSIKLPQLERFTHAYSRDTARSRMLQMATIGTVLAAVLLIVMVFAGIGDLKSAVKDLQLTADAQLQAMQNQPQIPNETDPPVQTDPEEDPTKDVTEDPTADQPVGGAPLALQKVRAELTLYNTADGAYAAASMKAGDSGDGADAWVSTVRAGSQRRTNVSWILEESGDRVDVSLSESYGGESLVSMTLSWDAEGDTFSDLGSPVCIWEYQVGGNNWEPLPTENLTPIGGGCELEMSADTMKLLLAQYSRMELRCRVSMSHGAGGSLEVLVDGLMLDENGLAVNGGLLH